MQTEQTAAHMPAQIFLALFSLSLFSFSLKKENNNKTRDTIGCAVVVLQRDCAMVGQQRLCCPPGMG
jgi:hypothetical protein